ncbi:hypothetical protein [Vibrio harveyi]
MKITIAEIVNDTLDITEDDGQHNALLRGEQRNTGAAYHLKH